MSFAANLTLSEAALKGHVLASVLRRKRHAPANVVGQFEQVVARIVELTGATKEQIVSVLKASVTSIEALVALQALSR